MALRDEIKAARKDLVEHGTFKEKLAYFFDYYTLHTVIILTVLIATTCFIVGQITKPEVLLNGITLNVLNFENTNPIEDLNNDYMEYLELDPSDYELSINTSLNYKLGGAQSGQAGQASDYEISQAIMVQCAAGAVDFIASPLTAVIDYGYGQLFMDIRDVLTKEQIELYEPYFLYVDMAVIDEKNAAIDRDENADLIPIPDPTKPEEMKNPIPVFINLEKSKRMSDIYSYSIDTIVFGVPFKAPTQENIPDFLTFLFEE